MRVSYWFRIFLSLAFFFVSSWFPVHAQMYAQLKKAIDAGLNTKTQDCNTLVQAVATAYGFGLFGGKTADQIGAFLESNKGKLVGGRKINAIGTVQGADIQAFKGDLVVGVIDSQTRNKMKPKGDKTNYTHGHVFVVYPHDKYVTQWNQLVIANAGTGGSPAERTAKVMQANFALREWERPHVRFYYLSK